MRKNPLAQVVSFAISVSLAGIACADANLTLPDGFTATVAQEGLGTARHLAVVHARQYQPTPRAARHHSRG